MINPIFAAILDPSWISAETQGGFLGISSIIFRTLFQTYAKFSAVLISSGLNILFLD